MPNNALIQSIALLIHQLCRPLVAKGLAILAYPRCTFSSIERQWQIWRNFLRCSCSTSGHSGHLGRIEMVVVRVASRSLGVGTLRSPFWTARKPAVITIQVRVYGEMLSRMLTDPRNKGGWSRKSESERRDWESVCDLDFLRPQ